DVARFRRCAQLPDAHVFTQRPQREDGGEGDAEPGGDVPLRDGELVTLRDEPRGEAGAAARGDGGLADVGGGPGGGDPVGRGERGQVDDAAAGLRVVLGQQETVLVVEQVHAVQVVGGRVGGAERFDHDHQFHLTG